MPIEVWLLEGEPVPFEHCPQCGEIFVPFLRGMIQRSRRSWLGLGPRRAYCALICSECKEIVGHESPNLRPENQTP
jgi:hypothetical protein